MIDTHDFVRRLETAGIERRQAEVFVELYRETSLGMGSQYVTHQTLRYELQLLKNELLAKLGGLVVGCSAILGVLVSILALKG